MKSRILTVLFTLANIFLVYGAAVQNDQYQYQIDLVNVKDDQVKVELIAPKIKKGAAVFQLPKIVPGTYSISDFGRFITDFKAFDQAGKELAVNRLETNAWEIPAGERLYRLSYWVNDTYDAGGDNLVSGMGGTNIEAGKNFVLNGSGFFGYFAGMKFQPYAISVKKPKDFYGSSAYVDVERGEEMDLYKAPDYHYVVDMPIMYNKPDTVTIQLGQTEVLISVYSPGNNVQADFLAGQFRDLLNSQRDYLQGKLPVSRYAFIMYFGDPSMAIPTGALEHNYSSFYCLPDYPQQFMASILVDIAAHEFFHILTPLNIHSEEIHYFDFNDPNMSQHLWLYEGVTEYFSHHNQVRSGLIDQKEFLDRMSEKIKNSQSLYQDNLAFTELSRNCLDEHAGQYGNVYEKGALIGMCLDIELLRLSKGSKGLIDLMQDLAQTFGVERPFKDKRLFKEIKKRTHPKIKNFFKEYVDGDTPLPYDYYFGLAGVEYVQPPDSMIYSLGGAQMGFNQETGRLSVAGAYQMNAFGRELDYQVGDILIALNGQEIPTNPIEINPFLNKIKSEMKDGDTFTVDVIRKDENGVDQKVQLSAVARKMPLKFPPTIQVKENAEPEEEALRKAWLGE